MKRILILSAAVTLLTGAGCIVPGEGPHAHGGGRWHGRAHGEVHTEVIVPAPPTVVIRPPTVIIR